MGQELSQLVARRPVQEFKQRFLDHAASGSAEMPMSQPVYNVIKAERRLAESWAQVEADDRAVREQMEREEAERITEVKEEKARQEAKRMEEELEPTLEDKQKFVIRGAQVLPEAQVTQEATAAQNHQLHQELRKLSRRKVHQWDKYQDRVQKEQGLQYHLGAQESRIQMIHGLV